VVQANKRTSGLTGMNLGVSQFGTTKKRSSAYSQVRFGDASVSTGTKRSSAESHHRSGFSMQGLAYKVTYGHTAESVGIQSSASYGTPGMVTTVGSTAMALGVRSQTVAYKLTQSEVHSRTGSASQTQAKKRTSQETRSSLGARSSQTYQRRTLANVQVRLGAKQSATFSRKTSGASHSRMAAKASTLAFKRSFGGTTTRVGVRHINATEEIKMAVVSMWSLSSMVGDTQRYGRAIVSFIDADDRITDILVDR
jgi:hypothetical protein